MKFSVGKGLIALASPELFKTVSIVSNFLLAPDRSDYLNLKYLSLEIRGKE